MAALAHGPSTWPKSDGTQNQHDTMTRRSDASHERNHDTTNEELIGTLEKLSDWLETL